MAGGKGSFEWESDSLTPELKTLRPRLDGMIAASTEYQATKAEAYAKQTAPWQDQTGNARNGLTATAEHVPFVRHSIIISHGVPYGIWLEVRYSGKNAVVMPTAVYIGKQLLDMIGRQWGPTIEKGMR